MIFCSNLFIRGELYDFIFCAKEISVEEITYSGIPTLIVYKFSPTKKLLALVEIPNYKIEKELVDFSFSFLLERKEDWILLDIKTEDDIIVLRFFFFIETFNKNFLKELINFFKIRRFYDIYSKK